MGRPLKDIDPEQVRRLASIMCTNEEIAAVLDCSVDTLARRFAEVIENGHDNGRASLRRRQWEMAEGGDRTMLVWLGKQWLGQQDKSHVENAGEQTLKVIVERITRPAPD